MNSIHYPSGVYFDQANGELSCLIDFFLECKLLSKHKNLYTSKVERYTALYDIVKSEEFRNHYLKLIKSVTDELRIDKYWYQKIPSLRLQYKAEKSVNFHSDTWYGHGKKVINVWAPIENVELTNTLYYCSQKNSDEINEEFSAKKLELSMINEMALEVSKPVLPKKNEIFLFNSTILHGTVVSKSESTRLSLDFRILVDGEDPGTKSLWEFYEPSSYERKSLKTCIFYLYTRNLVTENLSHSLQRQIVIAYCERKNLISNGIEETEIHGVNHYPNLRYYIQNKFSDTIVMASINCLPTDEGLCKELVNLAKENEIILHFALENSDTEKLSSCKIWDYLTQTRSYHLKALN